MDINQGQLPHRYVIVFAVDEVDVKSVMATLRLLPRVERVDRDSAKRPWTLYVQVTNDTPKHVAVRIIKAAIERVIKSQQAENARTLANGTTRNDVVLPAETGDGAGSRGPGRRVVPRGTSRSRGWHGDSEGHARAGRKGGKASSGNFKNDRLVASSASTPTSIVQQSAAKPFIEQLFAAIETLRPGCKVRIDRLTTEEAVGMTIEF